MTLWGFLTVLGGAATFGAALSVACNPPAQTSWVGMAVGLFVSVVSVVLFRSIGDCFGRRIATKHENRRRETAYRNLYIAAFIWIIASSVVSFCLTGWVMRVIAR